MTMLQFRGEAQKAKAPMTMFQFREETQTSVRLRVRIIEVIGCDQECSDFDPLRPNKGENNVYYVTLWVDPDYVYKTPCVSAKKFPHGSYLTWSYIEGKKIEPKIFEIELNPEIYQGQELKLEVIRTKCFGEIGTSNGNVVVGRATIKMSKVSKEGAQCHAIDLARTMIESSECRMEGTIIMDMKMDSITRPVRSWYW